MNTLNKEQHIAKWMIWINTSIGVIAFIPTMLSFLFTVDAFFPSESPSDWAGGNVSTKEKLVFLSSSILLLVFYGYTFFNPLIFRSNYYNRTKSRNCWLLIIVVNILALILFAEAGGTEVFFDFGKMILVNLFVWLPVIPLITAFLGLVANLNLQAKESSTEN